MKRILLTMLLATHALATPIGNNMPKDDPIEATEPERFATTLPEVVAALQADPAVYGDFSVCVKGDCAKVSKQAPAKAPTANDAASAVERIAGGLVRATGGHVEVTFTYHEKTINADGSSTERDVNVTIAAGTGAGPSGFDESQGKMHL